MTLKFSKTPLLIAAMATAVTLTSFGPANANAHWASADAQQARIVQADFQISVHQFKGFKHHGVKKHHGFKTKSFHKKKVVKPNVKRKVILKKLF